MTTRPLSALTMLLSRHTKRREFITLLSGAGGAATLEENPAMHHPPVRRILYAVCARGARSAASAAAVVSFAVAAGTVAQAQAPYPAKPVKLAVGFAPGGPTDILARAIGPGMSKALGEQFYVWNLTGGRGSN